MVSDYRFNFICVLLNMFVIISGSCYKLLNESMFYLKLCFFLLMYKFLRKNHFIFLKRNYYS